jgi:hypothetical protein
VLQNKNKNKKKEERKKKKKKKNFLVLTPHVSCSAAARITTITMVFIVVQLPAESVWPLSQYLYINVRWPLVPRG